MGGWGGEGRNSTASVFLVLFVKIRQRLESRKNTTVSAAILSPAVGISNVMNKAALCGKKYQIYHFPTPFSSPPVRG